jgi:hypothetical protein
VRTLRTAQHFSSSSSFLFDLKPLVKRQRPQ